MLSARLRLLDYVPRPLRHNAQLSFYTGSAEAMARVRLLEADELKPGETSWVQLWLDRPVAVVNGDHFIIRSTTETLGGGKVVDAHARRLRRFRPEVLESLKVKEEGTAEDVVMEFLEQKQPLELSNVVAQSDLPPGEVSAAVASLIQQGRVLAIGRGDASLLFTASGWQRLAQQTVGVLQEYHHRFPARLGMPRVELGNRLRLGAHASEVLSRLASEGTVVEEGLIIRLPEHRVRLTPAQQAKIDAFLRALSRSPYAPPGDIIPEPDLLNLLVERQQVVKVSEGIVFAASAYSEMVDKVMARIRAKGKITLAEVRDMFHTSRKYAQALLEHLDSRKITRRVGDERVLY